VGCLIKNYDYLLREHAGASRFLHSTRDVMQFSTGRSALSVRCDRALTDAKGGIRYARVSFWKRTQRVHFAKLSKDTINIDYLVR
jgi:hypothetical protein